jgi:hypothetical protein
MRCGFLNYRCFHSFSCNGGGHISNNSMAKRIRRLKSSPPSRLDGEAARGLDWVVSDTATVSARE